jgi:hypothetical protein
VVVVGKNCHFSETIAWPVRGKFGSKNGLLRPKRGSHGCHGKFF